MDREKGWDWFGDYFSYLQYSDCGQGNGNGIESQFPAFLGSWEADFGFVLLIGVV